MAVTIDGTNGINDIVLGSSTPAAATVTTFTSNGIDDNADALAITIDSSENVGIGKAAPVTLKSQKTLQVLGNAKLGSANDTGLLSLGDVNATGANAGIWRGAAGAFAGGGNYLNLGGYSGITFTTGEVDIASQTEHMRIDVNGKVGIGTVPPTDTHSSWSQLFLGEKGSFISENANSGGLFGNWVTDNLYVDVDTGSFSNITTDESSAYNQEAGIHRFYSQASGSAGASVTLSEKMRIDSAGNVGIGTAAPASKLDVVTAGDNTITSRSTGGAGLFAATGVANAFTGFFINSVSTNLWSIQTRGDTNLHLYRNSGSGNVLIDNCNVGIGTASPTAELHIKAAAPEIVIQDGATDSFTSGAVSSSLSFQARNSSVRVLGQIDAIHESTNGTIGGMRFQTRTGDVLGERVRINSTGNVGIGTPGGTGKLAVLGDSINFYPSADSNSNGIGCAINGANVASAGAASARLFMSGNNSAHSGNLDLRSGSVVSSTLNMFATTGTQAIFLTTNGSSYFNGGNVGIGTPGPTQLLHLKSTGPAVLFIEADSDNVTESDNARIILSQDGGAVVGRIGYGVNSNAIEMVNQFGDVLNFGTNNIIRMSIAALGTVNVVGTFTAGTKTFRIDHPVPSKTDTHYLLHSSIEGPQADLIYRGRADLVSGTVDVNIDTAAGMTEGTFEVLCTDVQCFTSNEDGWTALKGAVTGNVLTITAQDDTCTDTVSWMVIGERKDAKMIESEWADDNGKLIVETLKSEHE